MGIAESINLGIKEAREGKPSSAKLACETQADFVEREYYYNTTKQE